MIREIIENVNEDKSAAILKRYKELKKKSISDIKTIIQRLERIYNVKGTPKADMINDILANEYSEKEILKAFGIEEAVTQDYSIWKVNKGTLEDDVNNMEKALKNIVGNTDGGLVPEVIRTSKEYKKADLMFRRAFKNLQDFNKKSPKAFQRKMSKETRFKGIK